MDENTPTEIDDSERWMLIRDTAVLQVKLVIDGLRDFLLVPASLIAAIVSLSTTKNGRPGPHFYQLLALGKQSERSINLFGAYDHAPDELVDHDHFGDMNIDELVVRVESFVVDEYKRGGMTAQAKSQIDKALNAIQRRGRKRRESD
jgi:hypothetical protein